MAVGELKRAESLQWEDKRMKIAPKYVESNAGSLGSGG